MASPNLGFRIERDKKLPDRHLLVRDDGKGSPYVVSPEMVALWGALQRAETVAEAAVAASRHGTIGDRSFCTRCGAPRPWKRAFCATPLGNAVAVWREGKDEH